MRFRTIAFVGSLLTLSLLTGSVLVWRLSALSILVLIVGYLWSYLNIRGIAVETKIPAQKYQVGDWIEEEHSIFNNSWLPKLMLKAQVASDLPEHQETVLINLAPRAQYSWRTRVFCPSRGRFNLGSLIVTTHDPFGLFTPHRSLGEALSLLVYPATVKLPYFGMTNGTEPGYGAGRWALARMSPSVAFIREYAAGDSLNHIHWHGTAHTGELMVKIFDADRPENASSDVWVIADMHQPSQGQSQEEMLEHGVTIAASLVKKLVESGKHTGLIARGDQSYFFLPQVRDGQEHLWQMLEALALVRGNREVTIEQVLLDRRDNFGPASTVILVTSSDDHKVADALREIRSRGATAIVVLLDAFSFGIECNALVQSRRLRTAGVAVCVVRKDDNIALALDNRVSFVPLK